MQCHLPRWKFFSGKRGVRIRFRRRYRSVIYRRRYTIRYKRRTIRLPKFKRRGFTIRVFKRTRRIYRLGKYWYIKIGRKTVRVVRRGRRRAIRWRRRWVWLTWRFRFRFKGVSRLVRCRRRRWSMRVGKRWRRIRRRKRRYVVVGRRRYVVRRTRRGRYRIRVNKRWRRVKRVKRRRRRK